MTKLERVSILTRLIIIMLVYFEHILALKVLLVLSVFQSKKKGEGTVKGL